jgi:DNA-binding transcriptional ArsR family regulator
MLRLVTTSTTTAADRLRDSPAEPSSTSGPPLPHQPTSEARPPVQVPVDVAGRDLLARFYRALGDPTRLALLEFCAGAERTGTECVAHTGLSQGRVSAHLACLVSCGLVSTRRDGRYAFYRVIDPRVAELVTTARAMVAEHAESIAACAKVRS